MTATPPSPCRRLLGGGPVLPVVLALLLSSACSILPEAERYAAYRLAPLDPPAAEPSADWTLRIEQPEGSKLVTGSRIPIRLEGDQLSAYSGARWVSPLPQLWRDHLAEAFRSDGRLPRITGDGDQASADLTLQATLRAFWIETPGSDPQARVAIDTRLVDTRRQRILETERFEATAGMDGHDASTAVTALGTANNQVVRSLIDWTLEAAPTTEDSRESG
ncbi:MAG: ABC-type transport auxiliary lipoprotein family protein [Halorhodospira sp.]